MSQLPPIVLECPECGEKYLVSANSNTPTDKAEIYSDGYFIDEINWRTPEIIGCVTCELGFFPNNGKVVAKPNWDEFCEKWTHVKKAEPPTAGSLALELRARKNMSYENELSLRKELWYAGLHSETGRLLLSRNQKFNQFWNDSLIKFEEMLSSNDEQVLLKAEVNRQLGNFDRCIKLLEKLDSPLALQLKREAAKSNAELFQVAQ